MKMQQDFIEELENRGNANIDANNQKIDKLDEEVAHYMKQNSILEKGIERQTKDQENFIGAREVIKTKQSSWKNLSKGKYNYQRT